MGGEQQLKAFRKVGKVCVKGMNASNTIFHCVLFLQYFKALLKVVKSGRTEYENLLPMTIYLD